jgi:hypothetical protein
VSLCVGIDFNTSRVDVAAIPLDPDINAAPVCHHFDVHRLGDTKAKQRPIDYQRLRRNLHDTIETLENLLYADVVTIWIEAPAGRVHPNLYRMHGALLASCSPRIQTGSIYPIQWRQAIGHTSKDSKTAGHRIIRSIWPTTGEWDEHELDALGIATASRNIQWRAAT